MKTELTQKYYKYENLNLSVTNYYAEKCQYIDILKFYSSFWKKQVQ